MCVPQENASPVLRGWGIEAVRGGIRLEVGEVVHAAFLERVGSHALRCLKRVLYPRITLPDGWREVVPTNQLHWADEDVASSEFFGLPVGKLILIEGP